LVMLAELTHHGKSSINFCQYVSIGNCSGSLGVVLAEPECLLFVEKRVHARGRTGRGKARIDLYQFLLPIVEAELCTEASVEHRSLLDLLEGRHHVADRDLQSAVFDR